MKNRQKMFLCVCAVLVVLSALTACGGGGGGGSSSLNSDPTGTAPVVTAVGSVMGSAATGTIGAGGGVLTSLDSKLTISIPPGALAGDTVIGIQSITNNAPGARGVGYRLTPDGQTFLAPISLILSYDDQNLSAAGPDTLDIAFQTADGYWQLADTITLDTVNKTLTATTTHFCDWGSVDKVRIVPERATVGVGKTLNLQVQMCFTLEGARNEVTGIKPVLGHKWRSLDLFFNAIEIHNWLVNGIPGGNSTVGTINYGLYTAPATKPNPDTVEVTVEFNEGISHTIYYLRASIKIDDNPEYFGEMRFSAKHKDTNGDTWTATGWSDITLARTYDSGVASTYTLTTPTKIVFTSYETVKAKKTCTMISQVTMLDTANSQEELFIQKTSSKYFFTGALAATISMKCVDRLYDPPTVTFETGSFQIALMTSRYPADVVLRPLGDGQTLTGPSTYIDGQTTIDLSWGLARSGGL